LNTSAADPAGTAHATCALTNASATDPAGTAHGTRALTIGDRFEVEVGAPAHGGHCVARHEGLVVFVRHALPGERVIVEVTEEHRGYVRADAVEVLTPSGERVQAPCPYARPDGCGGCDLQHASPGAQLAWKAAVIREQLTRLARIDRDVVVEPVQPTFGWRTRIRYHVDAADRPGLLKHRSHEVVPIDRCLIAHPCIQDLGLLGRPSTRDFIDVVAAQGKAQLVEGQRITEHAMGHDFDLAATAFWQVHPAAAQTLAGCVLEMLAPQPGETALDLYGGAGLFAAAMADRGCAVTLIEADADGIDAARRSQVRATIVQSTVERAHWDKTDVIVLDPPRTGAGERVVRKIVAAQPRAIAYVACDPAALARDLRTFSDMGFTLTQLRAFDLFPQTHHVECVALITRSGL
jgi:tRNA/tmRNA/rRNA uracil-C5-methylase (TrmA/RlmC/RlmD family)